jgi:Holliday junction resolvasome RuvABC endonuclease subunit
VIVAAFDVASVTGVAVGDPRGNRPLCWSVDLGKGRSDDARFSQALLLAHRVIEEHKPDLVAVEAPIGGSTHSMFLIGMAACIRGVATNRGIKVVTYQANSVRKHFLGKALTTRHFPGLSAAKAKGQIKAAVIARCKLLGWDVPDDNAADAAALFSLACASARLEQFPTGGLFRGR